MSTVGAFARTLLLSLLVAGSNTANLEKIEAEVDTTDDDGKFSAEEIYGFLRKVLGPNVVDESKVYDMVSEFATDGQEMTSADVEQRLNYIMSEGGKEPTRSECKAAFDEHQTNDSLGTAALSQAFSELSIPHKSNRMQDVINVYGDEDGLALREFCGVVFSFRSFLCPEKGCSN